MCELEIVFIQSISQTLGDNVNINVTYFSCRIRTGDRESEERKRKIEKKVGEIWREER